jgi:hypothetical protein
MEAKNRAFRFFFTAERKELFSGTLDLVYLKLEREELSKTAN